MCTAYELGKRGGSFSDHLKSETIDLLLGVSGVHRIRPSLPAPVIVMDGSARTMNSRPKFGHHARAMEHLLVDVPQSNLFENLVHLSP